MKRVLSISLIYAFLCASILCVNATDIQQAQQKQDLPEVKVDLRDQAGIELPAGLVIPVLNMQEVSTQTCPEAVQNKICINK